jgi:hypothetical protein
MIPTQVPEPFHRDGWVYEEKVDGFGSSPTATVHHPGPGSFGAAVYWIRSLRSAHVSHKPRTTRKPRRATSTWVASRTSFVERPVRRARQSRQYAE